MSPPFLKRGRQSYNNKTREGPQRGIFKFFKKIRGKEVLVEELDELEELEELDELDELEEL